MINLSCNFDLNDLEFENSFESGNLPASLFTHEAHLRLAWIHLNKYDLSQALVNIPAQIQDYVAALGATDKYNHTLTIAAIRTVHHFMLKSEDDNFKSFISTFPRLKFHFKELLAQHYSIDIFNLTAAKERYLEPDLLPFD